MEYPTRGAAAMLSLPARALGRRQFLLSAAGMGALALSVADGASARAAGGVSLGAWTAGMDAKPALLDKLSSTLGQPLGIASVFRGEHDVWPGPVESQLAGKARTLLVSWHLDSRSFSYWASPAAQPYLSSVARRVKAYRRPVAIRPWAEMNGDWQPWRPTAQPTDGYASGYAAFMAAWRAVVGVFRAEGATNARWVFNPTTDSYAKTTDVRLIWPGRDVVDVLGLRLQLGHRRHLHLALLRGHAVRPRGRRVSLAGNGALALFPDNPYHCCGRDIVVVRNDP